MRFVNVVISIGVSLVIALLLLEGGLRLLGSGPPDTLNRFDPKLGWSKKPDHEIQRRGEEFDVTIATNGLGLRDDPMESPAKPDGVYRVVVLGDSFTLGYTVDREDLFVDLLERRWQAEGRPVEVVNVGTEGWSTDQEVAWLIEHGRDYAPDLVLLAPYDNDVFWCSREKYTAFPKPMFSADGEKTTGILPDTSKGWGRTTALGRLLTPDPTIPTFETPGGRTVPADFAPLFTEPPAVLEDSFERTAGALMALREECLALASDLAVVPIPSHASVDTAFARRFGTDFLKASPSAWDSDRVVDFFLAECERQAIPAFDPRDALREAHAVEPCYFDFFGPDREWHFTPAGNHAYASFVAEAVEAALPPATQEIEPEALAALEALEPGEAGDEGGVPTFVIAYGILWATLTALYFGHYRDEPLWMPPLKVAVILAFVFALFLGVEALVSRLATWNPAVARGTLVALVALVLGFVGYKMGSRLATIAELLKAFTLRGHWYLMPMVVVLLTIGSLLVVAASSPFVAPFIYTLF